MMTDNKKWYLSKTLWAGVFIVAMTVVKAISDGGGWESVAYAALGAAVVYFRKIAGKVLK